MMEKGYWKSYYDKRKIEAIALLGGKCSNCKSVENLQFDHKDPSTKRFAITGRLRGLHSLEVRTELLKCQLLCKECHDKKSQGEAVGRAPPNKGQWKHGTTTGYCAKACRCQECKSFYAAYRKKGRREKGWT